MRTGRRICLLAAAGSALALAALLHFGPAARQRERFTPAPRPSAQPAPAREYRPVYPYSVVPGGVFSRQEALRAAAGDRVVAAHYTGFDLRRARAVRLERDWVAHVSFRIENAVYWTRRPLKLRQGEVLLTDGGSYIRARCGNRVAEKKLSPTTAQEPPAAVLDTPEPPALSPRVEEMASVWPGALPPADSPAAAPPITDVNRNLFDLIPMVPWSGGGGGVISSGTTALSAAPPAEPPQDGPAPDSPAPADSARVGPVPPVPPKPSPEPGALPPPAPPDWDVNPIPIPVPPGDSYRIAPAAPGGGDTPGITPGDEPRPPLPPSPPPPPPPLPPSTPPEYIVEPRPSPPPPAQTPEPATLSVVALALAAIAGRARRR